MVKQGNAKVPASALPLPISLLKPTPGAERGTGEVSPSSQRLGMHLFSLDPVASWAAIPAGFSSLPSHKMRALSCPQTSMEQLWRGKHIGSSHSLADWPIEQASLLNCTHTPTLRLLTPGIFGAASPSSLGQWSWQEAKEPPDPAATCRQRVQKHHTSRFLFWVSL